MFASKSERTFYDRSIHDSMPADVVEISADAHMALLIGESQGQVICWEGSCPMLIDPPSLDSEELAAIERAWRDAQLALTDPLVSRHRDEVEEGGLTSITAEQYTELQAYRRQLRDWPQGSQFPLVEHRPPAPTWLSAQPD